jgi:hypothetical protein
MGPKFLFSEMFNENFVARVGDAIGTSVLYILIAKVLVCTPASLPFVE